MIVYETGKTEDRCGVGRLAWLCYIFNARETSSADSLEAVGDISPEPGAELRAADINLRTCQQLRNGILSHGPG